MAKRVLFIGIGFYDYDRIIAEEFRGLGYEVDYYCEVPGGIAYRLYARLGKTSAMKRIAENVSRKIAEDSGAGYDLVFVIKGEHLTDDAIQQIKAKNPNSRWILYLWDSVARIPASARHFAAFDKIYSFDRVDCEREGSLIFNPLFFRKEYDGANLAAVDQKQDLYFLGWYHSDRMKLVQQLAHFCKKNALNYRMILFTGWFSYQVQRILGGELKGQRELLTFRALSARDNFNAMMESRAVLDIAHPKQSGLTMRTIELVGAGKKIITTNPEVVHYDFYDPANIQVIDRIAPEMDPGFFRTPYKPLDEVVRQSYSITNWLKRMV